MFNSIEINLNKEKCYLYVDDNIINNIDYFITRYFSISAKVMIVSDSNIAPIYLSQLTQKLIAANINCYSHIVPAGESSKNFHYLQILVEDILQHNFKREDVIISLGGGVVGDLTGFACSIAKRGMKLVHIPTSLLAQVDSSIGGKTGINSKAGKNTIGSFYQPKLILTDVSLLSTLPKRELIAGYAEVVKYGLINDILFFNWLKENWQATLSDTAERKAMITHAIKAKIDIVQKDEKEENIRALLNLGHTFAHALEAAYNYDSEIIIHGEAVAIGLVMALEFSQYLGYINEEPAIMVSEYLKKIGLPTSFSDIKAPALSLDDWLTYLTQDKKHSYNNLTFILCKQLGESFIDKRVKETDLQGFLTKFYKIT